MHDQKLPMGREALKTQVPLEGELHLGAQSVLTLGGVQTSMEEKEEMKEPKSSTMLC